MLAIARAVVSELIQIQGARRAMTAIGMLVLGWLLGLLAPEIVYKIRTGRRLKAIERGLLAEVRDAALRIGLAASRIDEHLGNFGRENLEARRKIYMNFGNDNAKAIENLDALLAKSDADLALLKTNLVVAASAGLGLRKQRLPFIDSKINELELFGELRMSQLLDFRAQVEQFNELVEDSRMYFKMTFDVTGQNHAIVTNNLTATYSNVMKKAENVVTRAARIADLQL